MFRHIQIPSDTTFPVKRVLIPKDATLVAIRDSWSCGNLQPTDESLHVLSDLPENMGRITTEGANGSLRKKLWREISNNRDLENEKRRKRMRQYRSTESVERRATRLRKQGAWYRRKHSDGRLTSSSPEADIEEGRGGIRFSENQSYTTEGSDAITGQANSIGGCNENERVFHSGIHTGLYLYELHVETQRVLIHTHLLKRISSIPQGNALFLRIESETGEATIDSGLLRPGNGAHVTQLNDSDNGTIAEYPHVSEESVN